MNEKIIIIIRTRRKKKKEKKRTHMVKLRIDHYHSRTKRVVFVLLYNLNIEFRNWHHYCSIAGFLVVLICLDQPIVYRLFVCLSRRCWQCIQIITSNHQKSHHMPYRAMRRLMIVSRGRQRNYPLDSVTKTTWLSSMPRLQKKLLQVLIIQLFILGRSRLLDSFHFV